MPDGYGSLNIDPGKKLAPYAGLNLAPREPLVKLGSTDKPHEHSTLAQIIGEIHGEIKNRYLEARREVARQGELNANVRSGKLLMRRDPLYGNLALLKPLPGKPRSDRHVYPLAQVNSSQLTAIYTLSRPRVLPRHFGSNNRAQIQHALIEKVIEHYDARMDELFHQQLSLSKMDYGTAAIRVSYDSKLNALHQLLPVIENADKVVYEGFGFCRECMTDGNAQTFAGKNGGMNQCPDCGSYNVSDVVPETIASVPEVVGAEEVSQGDLDFEILAIPALNWDQRVMVHQSSYVSYRSEVPQRLISSILGLDVAEQNPDTDPGLAVINALGTRGGTTDGYGRDNLFGDSGWSSGVSLMDEEWYQPEWYAGRKLPHDEMSVSGEIIPKDVPLEKIFPDGIAAVGFNDMQVICHIGNEVPRIISGVYHLQSHSGVGKGTTDSVEISEQLNIAHSATLLQLKRWGAGGGYWYDKETMTRAEAKQLLKPDGLVGIKMRGTQYTSVDQAIRQLEHKPHMAESLNYVAALSNLMNLTFQTTEFTSGVANDKINVNTLGGQQMLQAQNQQRSAAPLRMKGYMWAMLFELGVLPLFREHIQIPMFFGTNDRFALTKGRMISGSDMPESVKCDFVADSELPTNTLTKQQATSEMLEKSQYVMEGGFAALMQFSPRMAAWFASMYPGVEVPLFNQTEILMVCQERLDSIAEVSAQITERTEISQYFPPIEEGAQEVLASIPKTVAFSEENHVIKAEVIKEYLDDDEVQEWSPLQRASVEALIQLHYEYDAQNRARVPMIDQQLMLGMQAQANEAAMAQAQPAMDAESDAALEAEGLSRAADEVTAVMEHDRGEEAADAAHERKLKEIKTQNAGRNQGSSQRGSSRKKR